MWIRCPKHDAKLPKPTAKPKCSDLFGSLKCSMMRAIAELKITCPIWYHLISKHKGTEMEKASLNSIQWCSRFPIYHDLDWGYLIRYTDIHDIHDWESETSEDLTDVAAPRRMRASNCTEKPLEMPITQRLARAIKTPTCKTPLAPYLSMLKPAGILSAL